MKEVIVPWPRLALQDINHALSLSQVNDERVDLCLWLLHHQTITSHEAEQMHTLWKKLPVIPIISKV